MIYFITGSENKFNEAKAILPEVERVEMDLVEIQSVDAQEIVEAKLEEALKHRQGQFIVEDTSLYFDCLKGLPGPLIKWFMKTIGYDGLYKIVDSLGDNKAEAKTIVGYAKDQDNISFFEGVVKGRIVSPRGETNFGWDPIFQPEGFDKTFAEMTSQEKNSISMRKMAFSKLADYLKNC